MEFEVEAAESEEVVAVATDVKAAVMVKFDVGSEAAAAVDAAAVAEEATAAVAATDSTDASPVEAMAVAVDTDAADGQFAVFSVAVSPDFHRAKLNWDVQ